MLRMLVDTLPLPRLENKSLHDDSVVFEYRFAFNIWILLLSACRAITQQDSDRRNNAHQNPLQLISDFAPEILSNSDDELERALLFIRRDVVAMLCRRKPALRCNTELIHVYVLAGCLKS